ncbi:unnamed protein product, partial [Durusdinium trenchii]
GASFQIDIQNFEQNQQVLLMGRTRRLARDNKTDIDSLSNIAGVTMLNTVSDSWSLTKSKLMELIDMTEVPESTLKEYMDLVDETAAATEHFLESVSTVTRTTTLMVVDILSPVPMTGHWSAGSTFRTALRLAEFLINRDQLILPGYELKHTILDDQCEGRRGANVVVSAMVSKGNYVGLTGMGCDGVCQQVSTLSSSFQLPFLSFNCPSQEFSNEVEFPSLLRMGTPTGTNQMEEIMLKLKEKHGWQTVFLVSGDPGVYSSEVERYAELFQRIGVQTQHLSALESRMADILTVMRTIKAQTQGSERVLFVLGDETFYRKLICASISEGLQRGLTWISTGSRRAEWWKRSDQATSFQRQWLLEAARSLQLVNAFGDLKNGWDSFRPTLEETRTALTELYVTEQRDRTVSTGGTEGYDIAHETWHPIYRALLYERNYYDIFFFDLDGNMIYSVYKEPDFATNFAEDSTGPWKDSGLGRAFREVLANPDAVSYAPPEAYGACDGCLASFLATGIRDSLNRLIGVYAIQLPETYEKSIEDEEAFKDVCTLEAIAEAHEGAINIVGLGRARKSDMEKPLPCFKGHSPRSLLTLLDKHLQVGFPEGESTTMVPDTWGH